MVSGAGSFLKFHANTPSVIAVVGLENHDPLVGSSSRPPREAIPAVE